MDGENNGKSYFLMDDLGVSLFLETPIYTWYISGIFPANWEIICYLPPFARTWNIRFF